MPSPGAHLAFPLRRWLARRERGLFWSYLAVLALLNALPLAWFLLSAPLGLEEKLEARGQVRWLPRYEALKAEVGHSSPAAVVSRCQSFLDETPHAQLREILGRPRIQVRLSLAEALLSEGRLEEAQGEVEGVVKEDPKDYRGWRLLGHVRWTAKDHEAALAAYGSALRLRPHLPEVVTRVASRQLAKGDAAAAWATFTHYRDALWVEEAALLLRAAGGKVTRGPLKIPVLIDGRSHTYRVRLGSGRLLSELSGPGRVVGIALHPVRAPGIRAHLEGLRIDTPRLGAQPSGPPLLVEESFADWAPQPLSGVGSALVPASEDEAGLALARACDLPPVAEWGTLSLSLRLDKPLPPSLIRVAREAAALLGRAGPALAWPRLASPTGTGAAVSVVGHIRSLRPGQPSPQPEIAAGIAQLVSGSQALVVTGDASWIGRRESWQRFNALIRRPAARPLLFAPGNHDLLPVGDRYALIKRQQLAIGGAFRLKDSLLLVLDSEREPGSLDARQLDWACEVLALATTDPSLRHVLVFMHRVLWFSQPRYDSVRHLANTSSRDLPPGSSRAWTRIFEALRLAARTKRVGVFAGDIGSRAPMVFDELGGVVLVASGNAGVDPNTTWWNHGLRVALSPESLAIETVSLGGQALPPPRGFDLPFWRSLGQEPLTPATLPRGPR